MLNNKIMYLLEKKNCSKPMHKSIAPMNTGSTILRKINGAGKYFR